MSTDAASPATVRSALEEIGAAGAGGAGEEGQRLVVCLAPALRQLLTALEAAQGHWGQEPEAWEAARSTMVSLASAVETAERLKQSLTTGPHPDQA
ncbi:hypothetical protein [Streptomyces sp. NPDC046939]|uniref:hypothetical protein n=1 Tax=Streptomyces sp. NPDC046939 TaxID=3155376 RepID=UPI0033C480A6